MSWRASLLAVVLAAAVCPTLSYAQNNGGGNGGGGGGGGGGQRGNGGGGGGGMRGNFDPARMQQMMMDRLKEQLNAQDDEWKVIEPKLSKVVEAQRNARSGGMMWGGGGRRGGGGGGGPGGNGGTPPAPTTKVGIAAADLQKALDGDTASPEEIDHKLTAYRDARKESQTQLETVRKDLKDVLTPKQEAVLVLAGVLE